MGAAMETVGVRELKRHLSRYLRRVRAGARLTVAERGRAIATIGPVEVVPGHDWAHAMVEAGRAQWSGGKPTGLALSPRRSTAPTVSRAVLEDRQ